MPKEKISMGLATYGRTYKLVDNSSTGIGAPSSGPGEPGKYTQEAGFLAYYEVRKKGDCLMSLILILDLRKIE
jgi:GH18 family chitinase